MQCLSLKNLFETKIGTVDQGLKELRELVTKFSPQCPRTHRSDEHNVEYHQDAVLGLYWAQPVISKYSTSRPPWNFQQYYTALHTAWLNQELLEEHNENQMRAQ